MKGAASLDRVSVILEAEDTIKEKEDARTLKAFTGEIEFKNVSFAYDTIPTLTEINLKIPKGKTIALVGQSGSGKTTIANLLPRFYDSMQGEILIDGIPVKDLKIAGLRGMMGIVTQDSILFNDTIFKNIAFGMNNAAEDDVISAAKIANAHDFIMETE